MTKFILSDLLYTAVSYADDFAFCATSLKNLALCSRQFNQLVNRRIRLFERIRKKFAARIAWQMRVNTVMSRLKFQTTRNFVWTTESQFITIRPPNTESMSVFTDICVIYSQPINIGMQLYTGFSLIQTRYVAKEEFVPTYDGSCSFAAQINFSTRFNPLPIIGTECYIILWIISDKFFPSSMEKKHPTFEFVETRKPDTKFTYIISFKTAYQEHVQNRSDICINTLNFNTMPIWIDKSDENDVRKFIRKYKRIYLR